jgi:hypothetical protein
MRYLPTAPSEDRALLEVIGVDCAEDLLRGIPEPLRLQRELNLPPGASEQEVHWEMLGLSNRNTRFCAQFLGAGAYDHFVPAAVDALISRQEWFTAYTPYQPEIAQGTLQALFEWQTFVALLTGLEISNASMYDGATATAEAVLLATRDPFDGVVGEERRNAVLGRTLGLASQLWVRRAEIGVAKITQPLQPRLVIVGKVKHRVEARQHAGVVLQPGIIRTADFSRVNALIGVTKEGGLVSVATRRAGHVDHGEQQVAHLVVHLLVVAARRCVAYRLAHFGSLLGDLRQGTVDVPGALGGTSKLGSPPGRRRGIPGSRTSPDFARAAALARTLHGSPGHARIRLRARLSDLSSRV